MKKTKELSFLLTSLPFNLFAWSVPFEDTLLKEPQAKTLMSTSFLALVLVVVLGFKASKKFKNEDYSAGIFNAFLSLIAGAIFHFF